MDVSIIIINYNTFELTCSCIDSVIRLTKDISYEIILVDNASTECSPDLFLQRFPLLKLIKSPVNSGFTGGNNLGIKSAAGDVILLLNSDVVLTENSIGKCFEVLNNNEKIGVVACMLKYPDGTIQKQCQRFFSIFRSFMELFRLHKLIPQPKRGILFGGGFFDHLQSIYCDTIWGTFFMFPSKVLEGFDNHKLPGDFFMYAEDFLWCYIIKKMGYSIYYNANTSVIHYHGASSPASSSYSLKCKHQNGYAFLVKYYGWLYAKIFVLLNSLLYYSKKNNNYAVEISKIYWNLFLTGKVDRKRTKI